MGLIKVGLRKNRGGKRAVIFALPVVALVFIIVAIYIIYTKENIALAELAGVWHYDQYTEYEFDGKSNGCLCLDGSNHFEFTYKVENDILYLDFVLDYVTDCQYSYTVVGDKLTLIGGEGTAELGKVYELQKQ